MGKYITMVSTIKNKHKTEILVPILIIQLFSKNVKMQNLLNFMCNFLTF